MKDPRVVSFSPMFHWTEHNIRVHTFTCVLALQIARLLRLQAERAGLHISVRELLAQLAGIGETVLIYPAERGRPKARRMLTETSAAQDKLIQVFQLNRHAPRLGHRRPQPRKPLPSRQNTLARSMIVGNSG